MSKFRFTHINLLQSTNLDKSISTTGLLTAILLIGGGNLCRAFLIYFYLFVYLIHWYFLGCVHLRICCIVVGRCFRVTTCIALRKHQDCSKKNNHHNGIVFNYKISKIDASNNLMIACDTNKWEFPEILIRGKVLVG